MRLTIVAVVLAALTACSAPGETSGSAGEATGPIKIANINAQSGQLSSLGKWENKGVKLAVDEANKAGGVNGRQIQLDLFDDQGDPTVGTNLARKISSEGYVAMLGTAESAVTLAMAPILKTAKIPNITSGQSPKLADLKSPFLFLNAPTSVTFDETLAKYLVDEKAYKKIALISNNGAYGSGEHDAFIKSLKSRNLTPVADEVVTPEQKDFNSNLAKIRQQNPEVLFIGAEEVQSGLIAKQARELGVKAIFAGGAPMGTDVYATTAGLANAEGSVVSSPYLSNEASPAGKEFATKYKAAYGEDAELHGAKAYDGASILIEALKKTGGKGGQELADAIRGVKRDGLLGQYNYDDFGVGIHETKIGLIKQGKAFPATAS
ncbi:branched-chain amino acid ABC transporter substrate-binding protein [Kribbella capetownensis]|uniref:Branched-chain amino acid ABC transporter substrate-binding protein n=1 Tax=Kribbella capetownensis TaxID=1572659 RepID=A0A4R0K6D5_9ACTN|nr:ABC transporter substrate-binding protein [Kribbella capetownensis]TCC50595.1 branched-chain amino acid ABC transporter substrate-binding protein [Kribbella capetownensis]